MFLNNKDGNKTAWLPPLACSCLVNRHGGGELLGLEGQEGCPVGEHSQAGFFRRKRLELTGSRMAETSPESFNKGGFSPSFLPPGLPRVCL